MSTPTTDTPAALQSEKEKEKEKEVPVVTSAAATGSTNNTTESWADAEDDASKAGAKKLPPLPGATTASATTTTAPPAAPPAAASTASAAPLSTAEQAAAELTEEEKKEKEKTDVLVLGSMMAQLGGPEPEAKATTTDAPAPAAAEEQLHLIQPFESHMSEQMFTDECFKIPPPILDALVLDMKKEKPFKIQASTLPYILKGRNVIAQAQAGAGKTIAFAIGMLARVDPTLNKLQGICLTPTRELARQIQTDALDKLKQRITPVVRTECLLAGLQIVRNSKSGAHIVIATPGKAVECVNKKYISLKYVNTFVLDEADFMVQETEAARSLGSETLFIRGELPPTCQIMFFSATYTTEMFDKARTWVPRAVTFKLASDEELMMEKIFKVVLDVRALGPGGKMAVLKELYAKLSMQQSIVFVEQKGAADSVSEMMNRSGYEVSCLHSDIKGPDRDAVMQRFRDSESRVLITTNVLARGVDVPSVAVVINFDLPVMHTQSIRGQGMQAPSPDYTTFVHRIGRTGRAERAGTAISLVESEEDAMLVRSIDHYFTGAPGAPGTSAGAKSMFTWWNATDISGLVKEIEKRQADREE